MAALYAGNPFDPAAWRETIARVARAPRDRTALAALLEQQLQQRESPPEALANARRLAAPDTVAIVTGQQAGFCGGPLYTLLKAISAIQLARRVSDEQGVAAVPVFWVESDDHDWAEVRTAQILDRDQVVRDITLPDLPGAGEQPIASLTLDDRVTGTLDRLEAALAPTEFTADVMQTLRRCYRPGTSLATAFGCWLDAFAGRHGLVVFESADARAKALVADLFRVELEHPGRSAQLANETGQAMTALGHDPQVAAVDNGIALFYLDGEGRRPIRHHDGVFTAGKQSFPPEALTTLAETHPERFSPNVLLRSIVQDRLFPTACYVAGPSELAYLAQLGGIYATMGVERPLVFPRASATLIDSAGAKFLERTGLTIDALQRQDDAVLNQLLERLLPPALDDTIRGVVGDVARGTERLKAIMAGIDPTLQGAVDTTLTRVQDSFNALHAKALQAVKRKDETVRRQFVRTRALAFPGGHPQERVLSLAFFANRSGFALTDRLLDALPLGPPQHHVLVL